MRLRDIMNRSLLLQALASNFLLVAASAVMLAGVFVWAQVSGGRREVGLRAEVLANFVAGQSDFAMLVGNRSELERISHNALSVEDVRFVSISGISGDSVVMGHPGFPVHAVRRARPNSPAAGPSLASVGGQSYFEVTRPIWSQTASSVMDIDNGKGGATQIGVVQIGVSVDSQNRRVNRSIQLAVLALVLSLGLVLAVQYLQLRRLLEPLKGLIEFTRRVGRGDLSRRAPVKKLDEAGRLAAAFNRMVEELGSTTVSKNYLDSIIRSMGEALIVVGPDGRISRVNDAAVSMLGYGAGDLAGRPARTLFAHEAPPCAADRGAQPAGERTFRKKTGEEIPVWFSALPMRGQGVKDGAEVWVALDITERKLAERQLHEAKQQAEAANLAKSELLSRTSHELRTPLNAILGFAQLLELADLNEDDRESLDQIGRAGRHLLNLINEVLDIAGVESGRRSLSNEPVRIGDVAREAIEMGRGMAMARNIEIRAALADWDARYVLADRQRLEQVLLNLISNAVKYNREGGLVTIDCEARDGRTRFSIRDTGAGIPPEGIAKLFRPFERLEAANSVIQGTGLGLACSKTFVEAMHGKMGVESTIGEGSCFWFELTEVDGPSVAGVEPEVRACWTSAPMPGGKILYVEDNPANLDLVRKVLAHYPQLTFLAAPRAEEGVRLAQAELPDLVLMDLHLPDFWGDEALRRLRADPSTESIPVVILSADATPAQIEALLAEGASNYLTKPLDCVKLVQLISEILQREVRNSCVTARF